MEICILGVKLGDLNDRLKEEGPESYNEVIKE